MNTLSILRTSSSWDGKAFEYPRGTPEITGMIVEMPPGTNTGWHLHPVPAFGVVLEGELEIECEDGTRFCLKSGQSVVEVVNRWHIGRSIGRVPLRVVVYFAGVKEAPLTVLAASDPSFPQALT